MPTIKVLGSGCANCQKLADSARAAATQLGADVQIEKVTDIADIMSYNVLATPGLVIDEQVVSSGRVPSVGEITTWLADALLAAESGQNE